MRTRWWAWAGLIVVCGATLAAARIVVQESGSGSDAALATVQSASVQTVHQGTVDVASGSEELEQRSAERFQTFFAQQAQRQGTDSQAAGGLFEVVAGEPDKR